MARLEEQRKTEEVVMEPKEKQPMCDEDCTETCILCGVGCVKGILKIGVLAWVVVSIILLAQTPARIVTEKCSGSLLWECLCTMVVLSGCSLLGSMKKSEEGEENNPCTQLILALGSFGVIIWAGIELFAPCVYDHFAWSLGIWEALFAIFIVDCFLFAVIVIGLCCLCIGMATQKEEERKRDPMDII